MFRIGILNFPLDVAARYSFLADTLAIFHDDSHPELHANYIDKHNYVDTNYVSSGGRYRMN